MPIPGVLVVHEWGLSVMQNGENQAITDTNGVVRFDPVAVEMSMLRRLLITVLPAARGLGCESYSSARCRVYLPEGSTVNLTEGGWNPAFGSGSMMYTKTQGGLSSESLTALIGFWPKLHSTRVWKYRHSHHRIALRETTLTFFSRLVLTSSNSRFANRKLHQSRSEMKSLASHRFDGWGLKKVGLRVWTLPQGRA